MHLVDFNTGKILYCILINNKKPKLLRPVKPKFSSIHVSNITILINPTFSFSQSVFIPDGLLTTFWSQIKGKV